MKVSSLASYAGRVLSDAWKDALFELTGIKITPNEKVACVPLRYRKRNGIPFGKHLYFPKDDNQHKIVVGATGMGKTTLAVNYVLHRKGVAFLMNDDGAAAIQLLQALPSLEKVVVLNHADPEWVLPIGSFPRPDDPFAHEAVINQWLRFFETNFDVDRMYMTNELIVMACRAVFSLPDTTFYDVILMVRNEAYRRHILDQLEDPALIAWWEEFEEKRKEEQVRISGAFLYRAENLFRESIMVHTLGYPAKNLDYQRWVDEGYTVLVIAPEYLGTHVVRVIMAIHALSFWNAALLRARNENQRLPFMLIADEPQTWLFNNAGVLDDMFSKGRKYGFGIFCLFQSFEQIAGESSRLLKIMRDNQPDLICFRSSNERSALKDVSLEELPAFNFYARLGGLAPFRGEGLKPPKPVRTLHDVSEFLHQQRRLYNVHYTVVREDIERRVKLWQGSLSTNEKANPQTCTLSESRPENEQSLNSSIVIV